MKILRKLLVFVCVIALAACAIDPLAKYDSLIQSYQDARLAAANGQSCMALVGTQLALQMSVNDKYLTADVTKAKVYRDALKTAQDTINNAGTAYVDPATGQPIPPSQLDLAKLAQAKATPVDQMAGFQLEVKAFTEAPLATIDPSVSINTQRIITQNFDKAMSCVADWNQAVNTYN